MHISLSSLSADTDPQLDDGAKGVAVGTPIAIIAEEGDDLSGADALANEKESAPSSGEGEKKAPESESRSEPTSTQSSSSESKSSAAPQKDASTQKSSSTTPSLGTPADEKKYGSGNAGTEGQKAPELSGDKPKFFASPAARKIALEKGVPLGKVKGTGPEGRITQVSYGYLLIAPQVGVDTLGSPTSRSTLAELPLLLHLRPAELELPPVKSHPPLRQSTRTYPCPTCAERSGRGCWRVLSNCPISTLRPRSTWVSFPNPQLARQSGLPLSTLGSSALRIGTGLTYPDRLLKLREVFNKAGEGKTKLSVNDFSEWLEIRPN